MPKVCMAVNFPDAGVDLSPLLESICGQTEGEVEVIVLSGRTERTVKSGQGLVRRMEDRGCTMLATDSRDKALSRLSCCDYVCFPDPDSVLEPDFVSTMIRFLEGSMEYGAVRCNGAFVDERDMNFTIARIIDVSRPHEGDILHSLLSKETSIHACTWMVRRASMHEDSVGRLPVEPTRWDWQLSLSLARGSRVGYIDKDLFRLVHRANGPMKDILTRYEERTRYEETFGAACLDTLREMNAPENEKATWRSIARIVSIKSRIAVDSTFRQWSNFAGFRDELSSILEECGGDSGTLDDGAIQPARTDFMRIEDIIGILTYHYSNLLLLVLMDRLPADAARWILSKGLGVFREVSTGRRFALYGAGGGAQGILPSFLALGFCPVFIWDKSARPGQTLLGVPVTAPRFSMIPEHERDGMEVIVAIGHKAVAEEVRQFLTENGFHRIINISEAEGVRVYFQNLISEAAILKSPPQTADLRA